jgi:hypothetical protein
MDFLVATGLALSFLVLSWLYGRAIGAGHPLNTFKKRVLIYGFMFVLGMVYLMVLVSDLRWPRDLLFPMIGIWGGIVGLAAWWGSRRQKRDG